MVIFLLFFYAKANELETKEEICFQISTEVVIERSAEINDYSNLYPDLLEPAIKRKVNDEAFSLCMANITSQDLETYAIKNKDLEIEQKFYVPLENYKSLSDLTVDRKYFFNRREIAKRVGEKMRAKKFELKREEL